MAPIQNDTTALPEGKTTDVLKPCVDTEECRMKNKVNNTSVQKGREFSFPVTSLSVAEDEKTHQVTIDVQDFKDGDVKVKVVDDNGLVVEGNIEKQQDGSVSKKSFYRRFSFPGLDSEQNVSASMSTDGVLTITVPKKEALSGKEGNHTLSNQSDVNPVAQHDTANDRKEVKVERLNRIAEQNVEKQQNDLEDAQAAKDLTENSPDESCCLLPICERGLFFHDCFFEDIGKEVEAVVDQMLEVFGEDVTVNNVENSEENLESNVIVEETRGLTLSEDQQGYQVVLDVRGYPSEDVRVRVEDKEVVVEGSVEKEEDSFRSTKSFCRRFNFPAEVDLKALTSAVSSDGVLTITAPKAVQTEEEKKEVQSC